VLLVVLGAVVLLWIEQTSSPKITEAAAYVEQDNPYKAEPGKALAELPLDQQVREALFQSVSARTGGMSTLALNKSSEGGKFWLCLLMLIGGSPAGTAGGMRTVVFVLLLLAVWRTLRRQRPVAAFGGEAPPQAVRSALAVAATMVTLVIVVTILLCATMTEARRLTITGQPATFMQLLYEAVSACSNSGFSCGLTPNLTLSGKCDVIAGMLLGRLMPMALFALLLGKPAEPAEPLPEQAVILA
jgi:trk system potassium uptake protein TrkH